MKTSKFFTRLLAIAMLIFAVSCDNDEGAPTPTPGPQSIEKLSQPAQSYLALTNQLNTLMNVGMQNDLGFGGGMSAPQERIEKFQNLKQSLNARTTDEPDIPVCATFSYAENADGSITTIIDFGDGCEFYDIFLKGKLIETFWEVESEGETSFTYKSASEFIGFGSEEYTINGTAENNGTWTILIEGEDAFEFEGTGSHEEDLTVETIEETYTVVSTESQVFTPNSFSIVSSSRTMTTSNGDTYQYDVISPLVLNYDCFDDYEEEGDEDDEDDEEDGEDDDDEDWEEGEYEISIFTEGVEKHVFPEGELSIDFGNGECDTLVAITENGETIIVDWFDLWECEDCED